MCLSFRYVALFISKTKVCNKSNIFLTKVPSQIAGNLLMENRELAKETMFFTMKKWGKSNKNVKNNELKTYGQCWYELRHFVVGSILTNVDGVYLPVIAAQQICWYHFTLDCVISLLIYILCQKSVFYLIYWCQSVYYLFVHLLSELTEYCDHQVVENIECNKLLKHIVIVQCIIFLVYGYVRNPFPLTLSLPFLPPNLTPSPLSSKSFPPALPLP